MAFKVTTESAPVLPIRGLPNVCPSRVYSHKLRRDVHNRYAITIPQFFAEPPARPDPSADDDVKNNYAMFALSTFFPYDRQKSLLPGETLWEQFQSWERLRPRGEQDVFAFHCLANVQQRQEARAHMRIASKKARARASRSAADTDHGQKVKNRLPVLYSI